MALQLKKIREDNRKTQEETANAIGVDPRTYQNYEGGTNEPKATQLIKLAEFFGVKLEDLFEPVSLKHIIKIDRSVTGESNGDINFTENNGENADYLRLIRKERDELGKKLEEEKQRTNALTIEIQELKKKLKNRIWGIKHEESKGKSGEH